MLGATTSLSLMINLIDTFFALMAIPTMLATIILAPKVVEALNNYKIWITKKNKLNIGEQTYAMF